MDFKVPMKELPVLVALSEAEPADYVIFLSPFSRRHEGFETVEEYLNGARRFFPMVGDGVPKIVNRDQVRWIRFAGFETDPRPPEMTIIQKLTILELTDGSRLEGYLIIDRPLEQSRISDVLNDPNETFVRVDDDMATYYVNKTFVRVAIPR